MTLRQKGIWIIPKSFRLLETGSGAGIAVFAGRCGLYDHRLRDGVVFLIQRSLEDLDHSPIYPCMCTQEGHES